MSVTAVELDFDTKAERALALGEVPAAMAPGRFVWLDVDFGGSTDVRADVGALGLCNHAVLAELSTRTSLSISEATQPFLANMAGTLERVLQDLLVDRDIVSDSLNLHMSIVSHRTSAVIKRLAAWSIMFLPLTFICGVYGMNFEVLPETKWAHGYLFFWGLVATIAGFLYYLLKRIKLL